MDSSKNTLPNEAYDDEISLRDLYLILKRNIFWIVSVPVLVAIVAFTLVSLMPPSYEAQSTTVVTPPPVEIDSDRGVRFQPAVSVPFESYERLALSNPVLTATLQELEELGEAPADLTLRGLSGMLDLEVLTGPGQGGQGTPLSVSHIVSSNDPELSATIANIWAQQSLKTVRDSLLNTLSPVNESTASEVGQLLGDLEQAEQNLETFEAQNNLPLRQARIEQLANRLTQSELLMDEIARRLTVSEVRRDTLSQQLEEAASKVTSSNPTSDGYLAGLSINQAAQFLELQRDALRSEYDAALTALVAFDEQHDLSLLESRINNQRREIAEGEQELDELRDELTVLRSDRELVAQQLADSRGSATAMDLSTNAFLSGLTLEESRELLQAQLERAEQNWLEALAALENFEAQASSAAPDETDERVERNRLELTVEQARRSYEAVVERANEVELALASPGSGTTMLRPSYDSWHLPPELALNDALQEVERQIGSTTERIAVLEARLATLREELPRLRQQHVNLSAERVLLSQQADRTQSAFNEVENRLLSLRQGALDPRADQVLRDTTPEVLALQAQLREEEVSVRAARSELEVLQEQVLLDEERLDTLRTELAALETQQARLTRARDNAQRAYEDVAQLEPVIAYMTQLTPTTARVLNAASAPMEASGPGRLLITVLAGLVTGMLTVLFVFLREAVRDPNAARGDGRAGRAANASA